MGRNGEDGARPFLEEDRERTSGICQKYNKRNFNYALGFIFHHNGRQTLQRVAQGGSELSTIGYH